METPDLKTTTAQPVQEEPELKRPKMSNTTSDDDETAPDGTTTTKKQRYKRRKIAIFFAYCGVGYQGMQKNPGAKTIEGDLEEALYLSGAVPEQDRGNSKKYDWARSARTDKGVSAVGQVVSGRFYIDPPGLVERLNSILPSQIRIFGYKRVTSSFNAKKFCDRRRYVYLIPVFALDPSAHPDRESVLASLGSDIELVKCLECSERGRKVIGAVGKRSFESKSVLSPTCISSDDGDAQAQPEINGDIRNVCFDSTNAESLKDVKVSQREKAETTNNTNAESLKDVKVSQSEEAETTNNTNAESLKDVMVSQSEEAETTSVIPHSGFSSNSEDANTNSDSKDENLISLDNGIDATTKSEGMEEDSKVTVVEQKVNGEDQVTKGSSFCYGEEQKERFNRILNYYVGSHNFHNFTTRTKTEDPSARRYIISFDAKTTVMVEGLEFVKCEVVGQSFMLHQIRKMIGLSVAVMRNCAPESLISTALQKDVHINVPTAPEVGLYLDECFFTSYNKKWKDSHDELSMKDYEAAAEEFKMKYIYSHVASTEHKEGAVALWLHSLNHRNYPDLRIGNNGDADDVERSAEAENMAEGM